MNDGNKADICFIVQLIEHSPEIVLIGQRRQGRHLLHSSVDRAFTRDCLDWRKETEVRHLIYSSVDRAFTRDCLDWTKEARQTFDL